MTITSIDIEKLDELKAWAALHDYTLKEIVNESIQENPEVDLDALQN